MQDERTPHSSLEAGPDDPLLGVYVLSQFVFCARAGVCAYETRQEAADDEPLPAQLDYLPRYEIYDIETAFSEKVSTLTWYVGGLLFSLAAGSFLALKFAPVLVWGLIAVVVLFAVAMAPTLQALWELSGRHRAFRAAEAVEPDADGEEIQAVNWFAMLQAGFLSVPYHRLTHDKWKLEGKPWRVLRRGNWRIPVFFRSATDQRLHPKHLAKVAAYCHLLQAVECYESPYGIVLQENSYEGVAIPNNARARKIFHAALRLARKTLQSVDADKGTSPPEQVSLCAGCPFGQPYRYQPGCTDGLQARLSLPIFVLVDKTHETIHHSLCGDRFHWMPPHKQTLRKGLEPLP